MSARISIHWCGCLRPRVFRFILASLRDRETAENLTQDCFVRAYQGRGQFRGASSIATWFMQIAANLVRNHESTSRLKFWRRSLHSDADVADIGNSIADRQQSPEAAALVQEQVKAIWAAAASLSARQRTVFLLRFVEGMDLLEIAEVTGMKEGTVKLSTLEHPRSTEALFWFVMANWMRTSHRERSVVVSAINTTDSPSEPGAHFAGLP
jgi:RNA polymerase sigma-70 factor (ECF subfamily)